MANLVEALEHRIQKLTDANSELRIANAAMEARIRSIDWIRGWADLTALAGAAYLVICSCVGAAGELTLAQTPGLALSLSGLMLAAIWLILRKSPRFSA
jgi:hypothetical protein